jgi:hypothetical protein
MIACKGKRQQFKQVKANFKTVSARRRKLGILEEHASDAASSCSTSQATFLPIQVFFCQYKRRRTNILHLLLGLRSNSWKDKEGWNSGHEKAWAMNKNQWLHNPKIVYPLSRRLELYAIK